MPVALIDYGAGNLHSVAKALRAAGAEVQLCQDAMEVTKASHIVLPGVGAFADCIAGLQALPGMVEALQEAVYGRQVPFLGICVGMQMLFEHSAEHGRHAGLGWLREAGKTLPDALGEVREAADFCRYYAALCRQHFAAPEVLPGPTGESNELSLHGRGTFLCISPWNFPLAIFLGQIAAAFAAGNAVIAKPAEQTPIIAFEAVKLLIEAGMPAASIALLPGRGETMGAMLVSDVRVDGIAFTGGTNTARTINKSLANREGAIIPFIAETGGLNVMIADSSALPEQVINDVIASSFNSAGQRCSALRILCVQKDILPRIHQLLNGAMQELRVGDPAKLDTDVGPVIDRDAFEMLVLHREHMAKHFPQIGQVQLPPDIPSGHFFAPCAFAIPTLDTIKSEVFGPILHILPFDGDKLFELVDQINATGYGLTLGIHSRIEETIAAIRARAKVGNVYVNRNQIGAVVGVQPFGGEGLSGTGPKAGGPHYLFRFASERTFTVNTAAAGGNAALIASSE